MKDNHKLHGVKLHIFTFEDSDITIAYRKLSPDTIMEFNRWFDAHNEEPRPPLQKVVYADGREGEEPNESHPEYEDKRRLYMLKKQSAMQRLVVRRSVVIELNDDQKAEVESFREFWQDEYGEELKGDDDKPLNDREIYIRHVACSTPEDLKDFVRAVSRRSIPTEEAISEASKSV